MVTHVGTALAMVVLASCASRHPQPLHRGEEPSASRAPIIYNMHEHIQSVQEGDKLLAAMDAAGITQTLLVGSSRQTIFSKGGFVGYDENNAQILTLQRLHPGRLLAFCTVNPRDPDKLQKLIGCVREGSKGVKLYSGHSNFHDLPLTDPGMTSIYAYAEQHRLPLLFHVNLGKFLGEFEALMAAHPRLIVIVPHLGLSSIRLERLESLLHRYPTLYTDLSFGYDPYVIAALKRISKHPATYRQFIRRHQDRVLFGTDIVVTNHPRKTAPWLTGVFECYRHMLERPRYRCSLIDEELNGLALDAGALRDIYQTNPQRVLGRGR